jgi:hypothetical protein
VKDVYRPVHERHRTAGRGLGGRGTCRRTEHARPGERDLIVGDEYRAPRGDTIPDRDHWWCGRVLAASAIPA